MKFKPLLYLICIFIKLAYSEDETHAIHPIAIKHTSGPRHVIYRNNQMFDENGNVLQHLVQEQNHSGEDLDNHAQTANYAHQSLPINPAGETMRNHRKVDTNSAFIKRSGMQTAQIPNSVNSPTAVFNDGSVLRNDIVMRQSVSEKEAAQNINNPMDYDLHSKEAVEHSNDQTTGQQTMTPDHDSGKFSFVEDNLYWSRDIEKLLPKGLADEEVIRWRENANHMKVLQMEAGTLEKCGRERNAYVVFGDGTRVCARGARPVGGSIAGELCAFELSRVLQMRTLPAITLSRVSSDVGSQWGGQRSLMDQVNWRDGDIVSMTQWIDGLGDLVIPEIFLNEPALLTPSNPLLRSLNRTELVTLVHWTELIVFDYIIGHVDRLSITYEGFRMYQNQMILRHKLHNINRIHDTGAICIVDNECAFVAGYSIFFSGGELRERLLELYEQLLGSVCIFRKTTVQAIEALVNVDDIPKYLIDRILKSVPLFGNLPALEGINNQKVASMVKERVTNVYRHIQKCKTSNLND